VDAQPVARSRWRTIAERVAWRSWLPRREGLVPLRGLWPKTWTHWLSAALILSVLVFFMQMFVRMNWGFLSEPMHQNDDCRCLIFPFHRYATGHPLRDDPVANEMFRLNPPFVRLMYAGLVPLVGLFVAVKVVQIACLLLIVWAGWILLRARRGGLAAGVLLVFFVLHTTFMVDRIAGGMPRAFAFPSFSLWVAGALAGRERERFFGAVLGCAAYPSSGALIVAAEGLYALRGLSFGRRGLKLTRALGGRLKRYALLVAVCVAVLLPATGTGGSAGPVHTLEQAIHDPAYGKSGRLWVLPFGNPKNEVMRELVKPFEAIGVSQPPGAAGYRSYVFIGPVAVALAVMLLAALRIAPASAAVWSFFAASVVLYGAAVVLAFRLYSPVRFLEYGLPMVTVALAVSSVGLAFPRMMRVRRATVRNLLGAAFMGLTMWLTGFGKSNPGMTIDGRGDTDLYKFARTLPVNVRFASHPMDGDDLPFWAARGTVGGFETINPWFVNLWKIGKARTEDTLRALYATDRQAVIDYTRKHGVTHFLLRIDRYGGDFSGRARMFEPFGSFAAQITRNVTLDQLVLARVPEEAVVYRGGLWIVVDASKLAAQWQL
jgi:hypothetical protein